jgi:flagellar hook-length control protein FliK
MDVLSAISTLPAKPGTTTSDGAAGDASGFLGLLSGLSPAATQPMGMTATDSEAATEAASTAAGAMMASLLNMMLAQPEQNGIAGAEQPGSALVQAVGAPVVEASLSLPTLQELPLTSQPPLQRIDLATKVAQPEPAQLTVTSDMPLPAAPSAFPSKPKPTAQPSVQPMTDFDAVSAAELPAPAVASMEKPSSTGTTIAGLIPSIAAADSSGDGGAGGTGSGEADGGLAAGAAATPRPAAGADAAFAGLMANATEGRPHVSETSQAQVTTGVKLEGLHDRIGPGEQVAVHLATRSSSGDSHITVQLKPVELGTVDVRIETRQDGDLSVHMRVERPETLELLQRDARQLERALNEAGIKADSSSLSFSLRQDQGQAFADRRWMQQATPSYGQGAPDNDAVALDGARPFRPMHAAADRVDITV